MHTAHLLTVVGDIHTHSNTQPPGHTPLSHVMLGYTPPCPIACWNTDPSPVNRMTDRCKNITLPQTSVAGGNNIAVSDFGVNNVLVLT